MRVHFENLRDGVERNFQIFPDGLLCSPYDYCSVMHYSQKAFSVSPITTDSQIRDENILQKNDKPTIETLRSVSGCPGLGQRTGMSGATSRKYNQNLSYSILLHFLLNKLTAGTTQRGMTELDIRKVNSLYRWGYCTQYCNGNSSLYRCKGYQQVHLSGSQKIR